MNQLLLSYPWLQPYWSQLALAIKQHRIPQALLITGNKGMGKQVLARHFAQSLLCFSRDSEGNFCGQCKSCTLFLAETHPDCSLIEPEEKGKSIPIAAIRQLTTKLSLKPQFDSQRVVIINPAENMNNAAANAFLKYLEEPTERTTLILITENSSKILATISSRCQKMFIARPKPNEIKNWLKQQNLLENSDIVLNLAKGSPLLAKQISEHSILDLRAQCFDSWTKIHHAKISFNEVAEKWYKLEKSEMEFLLFWLTSWVMDMIKLAYHDQAVKLYNTDLKTDLQELMQKLDLRHLYQYYDFLLLCQKRLDTQLNKQLMFEEILLKWFTLKKN